MSGAEHVDVLIVGAGISGIDAAYHLQKRCPGKSYLILEARERIGGTWDLFRYPGIRSDSDMYTLGFPFRPWAGEKAIVDGAAIRAYVEDTARAFGIDKHIDFGCRVTVADWSSADARWTVTVEEGGAVRRVTCGFLFLASGYYDYAGGYRPDWPGEEEFAGPIVHPQHWPEDLAVAGKRIVVIGSGATAVTLVPSLADAGAHVTMLQRDAELRRRAAVARRARQRMQRLMPLGLADKMTRWKNVLLGNYFFSLARRKPERARATILRMASESLPDGYDVERPFRPRLQGLGPAALSGARRRFVRRDRGGQCGGGDRHDRDLHAHRPQARLRARVARRRRRHRHRAGGAAARRRRGSRSTAPASPRPSAFSTRG